MHGGLGVTVWGAPEDRFLTEPVDISFIEDMLRTLALRCATDSGAAAAVGGADGRPL
jgi:hypothetical protein